MPKEQWGVVCTDLHICFGFFNSERDAEFQAVTMTAQGMHEQGCVFQPIRFEVINKVKEEAEYHGGQYL